MKQGRWFEWCLFIMAKSMADCSRECLSCLMIWEIFTWRHKNSQEDKHVGAFDIRENIYLEKIQFLKIKFCSYLICLRHLWNAIIGMRREQGELCRGFVNVWWRLIKVFLNYEPVFIKWLFPVEQHYDRSLFLLLILYLDTFSVLVSQIQ